MRSAERTGTMRCARAEPEDIAGGAFSVRAGVRFTTTGPRSTEATRLLEEEEMALTTAIRHLRRGDWQKAHAIVQNDSTELGFWAHGIAHLLEGDLGNARYWFRRAGRPFPREQHTDAEIDALAAAVKRHSAAA